jgi:hypothetical protein
MAHCDTLRKSPSRLAIFVDTNSSVHRSVVGYNVTELLVKAAISGHQFSAPSKSLNQGLDLSLLRLRKRNVRLQQFDFILQVWGQVAL